MFGYTIDEIMGQTPYAFMDEEWGKVAEANMRRRRQKIRAQSEYKFQRKDGTDLWILVSNYPIFRDDGSYAGSIGMLNDITERKRSEDELALRAQLLDSANDSIVLHDFEGRFHYANEVTCRFYGYTSEELKQKNVFELNTPESAKDQQFRINELKTKGRVVFEAVNSRKDGSRFPIEVNARVIEIGGKQFVLSVARDITERKQAEAALRESEERLRRITDNMLDMVCQTDARGIVQYASPSNESVMGYKPKDLLGKPVFNFVHPDDLNRVITAFQAAINASLRGKVEFRFKHADGRYLWVEVVGKPLFDDMGMVVGAIFGGRDITERKRAEEETREQLHFLQVLIDAIPAPIFYKDPDGIYQGCNNAFASMLCMSKEDIIGKSVFGVSPEEQGNKHREMDLALLKNPGVQVYDYKIRSADGLDHDVIFHKATYNDLSGRLTGLVGAVIDVTRLKQVEEKLRQRAAELQAVFQALPDLYFRLGADGTYLELLAGSPDDLYLPAEGFLGKRIQDVLEQLGQQFQRAIDQVLRTRSLVIIEYPLAIKGETKFFEARFFPLLEDQVIVVVRNITERKRDEEELERHRDHLEEMVAERTTELLAVNQELEAFTRSVSHDLRAPLRRIQGFSQILLEDYGGRLDKQGSEHLERLKASSQNMSQLIDDLLDLSRVTSAGINRQQTDLSAMAQAIVADLLKEQPERQAHLDIQEGITSLATRIFYT